MSVRHSAPSAPNFMSTCGYGHSALSALFPDGHSALCASDSTRISMQACAWCVVLGLCDMENGGYHAGRRPGKGGSVDGEGRVIKMRSRPTGESAAGAPELGAPPVGLTLKTTGMSDSTNGKDRL